MPARAAACPTATGGELEAGRRNGWVGMLTARLVGGIPALVVATWPSHNWAKTCCRHLHVVLH